LTVSGMIMPPAVFTSSSMRRAQPLGRAEGETSWPLPCCSEFADVQRALVEALADASACY
jgi:hypothetical protein